MIFQKHYLSTLIWLSMDFQLKSVMVIAQKTKESLAYISVAVARGLKSEAEPPGTFEYSLRGF